MGSLWGVGLVSSFSYRPVDGRHLFNAFKIKYVIMILEEFTMLHWQEDKWAHKHYTKPYRNATQASALVPGRREASTGGGKAECAGLGDELECGWKAMMQMKIKPQIKTMFQASMTIKVEISTEVVLGHVNIPVRHLGLTCQGIVWVKNSRW